MAYLLVAEVDKIQTFIMQSARLRQVVGASSMLEKFAENVQRNPREYLEVVVRKEDFIASAGGSFRIRFNTKKEAEQAGQRLRQKFEHEIGGSITIAPPVEIKDERKAVEAGNDELRTAKSEGRQPAALWHIPFQAICQSSGTELAETYDKETDFEDDTTYKYLGRITRQKGHFRNSDNPVLNQWLDELKRLHPELNIQLPQKPTEADTYASWDARQYVAYLVADGNSMGQVFNACDLRTAQNLSRGLANVTRQALAGAAAPLMFVRDPSPDVYESPLLPLIAGGDDVFALLPADWALDVTRRYLDEYERLMTAFWHETGVADALVAAYPDDYAQGQPVRATLGAAIVICKASYPYKSAHQYGEKLLKRTKDKAKAVAKKTGNPAQSMLSISWIAGSTVPQSARDSVRAYEAARAQQLVQFRFELMKIPSTTRERLRAALEQRDDRIVLALLERYGELYPRDSQTLYTAVDTLRGDGLYDLFNLWDFLLDADKSSAEYAEGMTYGN